VAMVGMVDLYFSALGERESLCGSAMRFYFHDCVSFRYILIVVLVTEFCLSA